MRSSFYARIISSFLLLILIISSFNITSCVLSFEKLEYVVNSDGETCTITGLGIYSSKDLIIPSNIDGYEVTAIADYAFQDTDIETFSGADTISTIGKYAFYNCQQLQTVTVPTNVTKIGEHCFEYCENLHTVILSSNLTKIEDSIFAYCSRMDSINIPDGIVEIGYQAFYWCKRLSTVNLPNTLKTIGAMAFAGCPSLETITLPDSLITIDRAAFLLCYSLVDVYIPASVVKVGVFPFGHNRLMQIQVDETNPIMSSINGDLYCNHNLVFVNYACGKTNTSFEILEGVIEVCSASFSGAVNLTIIYIPNTVKIIGSYIFGGADNITALYYDGTVADWNNIEKAYDWNAQTESMFTIICTDGTIAMDGTVTYN